MTFRQFAKQIDNQAIAMVNSGDLQKATAMMEVAAFIRRMDQKILRSHVPVPQGEN